MAAFASNDAGVDENMPSASSRAGASGGGSGAWVTDTVPLANKALSLAPLPDGMVAVATRRGDNRADELAFLDAAAAKVTATRPAAHGGVDTVAYDGVDRVVTGSECGVWSVPCSPAADGRRDDRCVQNFDARYRAQLAAMLPLNERFTATLLIRWNEGCLHVVFNDLQLIVDRMSTPFPPWITNYCTLPSPAPFADWRRPVTRMARLGDTRVATGFEHLVVADVDPVNLVLELNKERGEGGTTSACALHRDCLAEGTELGELLTWDCRVASRNRQTSRTAAHAAPVQVAAMRNGMLATCSWDKAVKVWDPRSLRAPFAAVALPHWATDVAQLDDGRLAVAQVVEGDPTHPVKPTLDSGCVSLMAGDWDQWARRRTAVAAAATACAMEDGVDGI